MPERVLKNSQGFTLVELMVVLAIIIIVSAIAIPMYVADLPFQRTKGAAQAVLSDLRLARSRAVSNNRFYEICFNSSTSYKIAPTPVGGTAGICLNPEKTVDFNQDYSGVVFGVGGANLSCKDSTQSMAPVTFPGQTARFSPRGSSVDGGGFLVEGSVYVTNPRDSRERTLCIQVEATTGRAKMWRWRDGDWK